MKRFILAISVICSALFPAESRVLIISIDGLRPDCALRAKAPHLRSLMSGGAFTFWAYTTPAAVTLPSHTSMLTGVTIEKHGISGNDDAAAASQQLLVPTIFELAKKTGISSGFASGKTKFLLFKKAESVTRIWIEKTNDMGVAVQATNILGELKPRLMFVHFPDVDFAGHSKGWGSVEQIEAIENTDKALGLLLDGLARFGLRESTTIILSADHGGSGKQHGEEDDRSKFIPWIINGPEILKDYDLTQQRALQVNTYDTFATACKVLGIPLPAGIDGKPVVDAFVEKEK